MDAPSTNTGASGRLFELARDVRRLGLGRRSDPESTAIDRDLIAKSLVRIATQLEAHRG